MSQSSKNQAVNPIAINRVPVNRVPASQQRERTQKVFNAIKQTIDNSTSTVFRAGDISQRLRDGGFPLGSWEIRGEFSALEEAKLIVLDSDSANWQLTDLGANTEKLT